MCDKNETGYAWKSARRTNTRFEEELSDCVWSVILVLQSLHHLVFTVILDRISCYLNGKFPMLYFFKLQEIAEFWSVADANTSAKHMCLFKDDRARVYNLTCQSRRLLIHSFLQRMVFVLVPFTRRM